MRMMGKPRAPRNRTITLTDAERLAFASELSHLTCCSPAEKIRDRLFQDDMLGILPFFPDSCVDLMILDPPYNLDKDFDGFHFRSRKDEAYADYLESWFPSLMRLLKPTGSVYFCGDWKCSAVIYAMMSKHLHIRNRIVWQREKGRGARANWKNGSEDIWFGTASDSYPFHLDAVKLKRRVIAPYRENGSPKDWEDTENGKFRLTCPSNFWDDISVPYWSMPENTDHPTQKPEKLLAKLILASSNPGDLVFDPFLGSGTTAVTAKKLGRHFCGIEWNREYCLWTLKRLRMASENSKIQGYEDGVFWERNSKK